MLNPFPDLLSFSFFAPTLLRLVVGGTFFYLAYMRFVHRKEASAELTVVSHEIAVWAVGIWMLAEAAIGFGLVLGMWTQIAAIFGALLSFKALVLRRSLRHMVPLSRLSYMLLGIICLSLLLTGAGALAFDLPL